MSQQDFIQDMLKTWGMQDCRLLLTPGELTAVELPEEGTSEQWDPGDILSVQKLTGALTWLSTRTRPDRTYAQPRISSMETKAPQKGVIEILGLPDECAGRGSVQACSVPDRIHVGGLCVSVQNPKPLAKSCGIFHPWPFFLMQSAALQPASKHHVIVWSLQQKLW